LQAATSLSSVAAPRLAEDVVSSVPVFPPGTCAETRWRPVFPQTDWTPFFGSEESRQPAREHSQPGIPKGGAPRGTFGRPPNVVYVSTLKIDAGRQRRVARRSALRRTKGATDQSPTPPLDTPRAELLSVAFGAFSGNVADAVLCKNDLVTPTPAS